MFSAGYDIGDIPDEVFAEEAERLVAHPFSRAIEAVEGSRSRRWRRSTGTRSAAGSSWPLTCDLRIAAAGVKLGMPPAKLGLIYSHTGIQKFLDAVGPARTRELFFIGRNVTPSGPSRSASCTRSCRRGGLDEQRRSRWRPRSPATRRSRCGATSEIINELLGFSRLSGQRSTR